MNDERTRPYYDREIAQAYRAEREALRAAMRELLGFGRCVIVPNPAATKLLQAPQDDKREAAR